MDISGEADVDQEPDAPDPVLLQTDIDRLQAEVDRLEAQIDRLIADNHKLQSDKDKQETKLEADKKFLQGALAEALVNQRRLIEAGEKRRFRWPWQKDD